MAQKVLSREIIERMIRDIAEGHSLVGTLNKFSVHPGDFIESLSEYEDLATRYRQAKQIRTEVHVDEIIHIADTVEDSNRARVMIDARKWIASKMNPSVYGDRIDVNVTKTVDIRGALERAMQRAIAQPIDIVEVSTGLEPVALDGDTENESDDDIFS
jgi:hypothetical protein